jgi:hypothetical protein
MILDFQSFLNENADSLNEYRWMYGQPLESKDIKIGIVDPPIKISSPDYHWSWLVEHIWGAYKTGKTWKVSFTLPKVANFVLDPTGIKITQIGDLRKNFFKYGEGTNFDNSVIGSSWYKKKQDIEKVLNILVRNCSRAALVNDLKFDFKHEYTQSLEKFGYPMGEHDFNPSSNKFDFDAWVDRAPRLIFARGSFTAYIPELVSALKQLNDMLPEELIVKIEIA